MTNMATMNISRRKPGERPITGVLLVVFFIVLGIIMLTPFASIILRTYPKNI
jgi:hypothetical protein